MKPLLLFICCAAVGNVFAQETGPRLSIVDEEGSPIPYVNAYAPNAEVGTVGDLDGVVELPEALAGSDQAQTRVRFSAIGFRDTVLAVTQLSGLASGRLVLAKATYELAEAEILGQYAWGDKQRLGEKIKKTFLCYAVHEMGKIGVETAVVIESGGERCRVEKVYLQGNHLVGRSAVLELNFYEVDAEGLPGAPLQHRPIRREVSSKEAKRTMAYDLGDEAVVISGDFAVSVELLSVDTPGGGLWLNMPCNPDDYPGRVKQPDGTWTVARDNFGLSVGGLYVDARCTK